MIRLPLLLSVIAALPSGAGTAAGPYVLAVVTDGPKAVKTAQEFEKSLAKIPPFSQMGTQFEVRIISADPTRLNCRNGCQPKSPRIVCCDKEYAATLGAVHGATRTAIVTEKASKGGAGGSMAVVAWDHPVLLHELSHDWTLADEYEFSELESSAYCHPPRRAPNICSFPPKASYDSDGQARQQHQGDIPWFGSISSKTLITTGSQLGTTPEIFPVKDAALYRGGNCNRVVPTWKPYFEKNYMELSNSTLIPPLHQAVILKAMGAERGAPIVLKPETQCVNCK